MLVGGQFCAHLSSTPFVVVDASLVRAAYREIVRLVRRAYRISTRRVLALRFCPG